MRSLGSGTFAPMSSWGLFKAEEPELARVVQGLFDARRHKTIATLRADGSPRISGIECSFGDGRLTFGSMAGALKLADLHRDPRFALHSATVDPVEGDEGSWPGEAKIAGRAISDGAIEGEGAPSGEMFVVDVTEVVFVHLDDEAKKLIVEWWTPDGGRRRAERF